MGDTFFICLNGAYREERKGLAIKEWIKEHIYPGFITARAVNSVLQLLSFRKDKQRSFSEINCYPDTWINFQKGMFDALSWQMSPHLPEYYSTNQIPHCFNLEAPKSNGATDRF